MKLKSTTTHKKPLQVSQEKWKPHRYQLAAVKRGIGQAALALFLDPGLGKTSIFLAIVKLLKKEKLINKVLVIAPLRVCHLVWPKELAKWSDFNGLTMQVLHGKDKEKNLYKDADIYLINPEGLTWLVKHDLRKLGFDMLGIDESSKFKATKSQRLTLLKSILKIFRRRIIMTGSPTPNSMMDLFTQIYILDGGASLGSYVTHYRNDYFYQTGFQGYEWKLIPGMEKVIQQKIKPLVLRLEAKDYLELPELIENNIYVKLDKNARAAYDEMEDELFIGLDSGEIEAVNAAASSMKCRQIANGGVYDEDKNTHHLHLEKAEAVKDLIEELNGVPAFVAYDFDHDLQRLIKVLGKNTPNISTANTKQLMRIEADWNAGKIPVLLGHPASVGHGLNLQGSGNHVIWHSLTWNFENYDQFNKRVWRQGNKNSHVFIHHIIAEETVDIAVLTALKSKDTSQRALLSGLKDYRLKIRNRA